MPLAMESMSAFRSLARLVRPLAVNQLLGLSRAEFTLLPVERRFCVSAIMSAVPLSERRFDRTAFESEMSDIYAILALGPSRPRWNMVNTSFLKGVLTMPIKAAETMLDFAAWRRAKERGRTLRSAPF